MRSTPGVYDVIVARASIAIAPCYGDPVRRSLLPVACLLTILSSSARANDGLVTITLAVPKDAGSAQAATLMAPALRDAFAGDTRFTLPDLEALLDDVPAPAAVVRLEEARRLKSKADLALSIVDLPVAADAYAQALVAFEQGTAALTDIVEVVDTFNAQATTFALLGDREAAQSAWTRALALDPGHRLPADATPRVKKIFDAVLKGWTNPPMGQLTVYSTSGAAEVWVDGVPRGAAPLTIDVPAGRHLVRVYREGFRAWGGAVEVKKGQEATAQAALKPTKTFAKLDELLTRLARNPDNDLTIGDLSRLLKADRLVLAIVATEGSVASVTGIAIDAVNGRVVGRAEKSLPIEGDFFGRDATRFVRDRLVTAAAERAIVVESEEDRRKSRLAGDAEQVETPGAVIAGWVLTGVAVVPLGLGVGLGIATLSQSDAFRSRPQVDPELPTIKNAWLFSAVGADVSYVAAAGLITGGVVLLVNGYAEQAAREDVLRPGATP